MHRILCLTFKVYSIFKIIISSSYPRLFCQHGIHVLVWDGWHHLDIWVIPLHPFFVHRNVLCIKQLGTWRVLACWIEINIYIIILDAATTWKLQVIFTKINALQSEILPNLWSDVEQESMKVCATTERQESTILDLWISNTKFGFFIKLTQNRSGRLEKKLIHK